MSKKFWIIIVLLVFALVGFIWFGGNDAATEIRAPGNIAPPAHIIGKKDATVSLVEYSDFQCSACGAYYPIVEQVVKTYQDRISFEYRHYPLTTIHRNAFAAARASEAAGSQDKFWEMYRLLFVNQAAWSVSGNPQATFESYAGRLGLDLNRYKADFASSKTNQAINASIQGFNNRGLPKSTPTFLLNGKKIQPGNVQEFTKLIDEQLAAARQ